MQINGGVDARMPWYDRNAEMVSVEVELNVAVADTTYSGLIYNTPANKKAIFTGGSIDADWFSASTYATFKLSIQEGTTINDADSYFYKQFAQTAASEWDEFLIIIPNKIFLPEGNTVRFLSSVAVLPGSIQLRLHGSVIVFDA